MNATNTFQDGLLLDSHPLAVPNNVLTNCLNGTLITYNGNELILQNDTGNSKIIYRYKDNNNVEVEEEVQLSEGFIPVGMKSYNGIIYILSHNPISLEGEIGTFPSPEYSKPYGTYDSTVSQHYKVHDIEYNYKPLQNLVDIYGNLTVFRTKKLNFDLQHPVMIDCQLSYDESVNLIFNDGKNIPRLVNSGFAPYGDNKVKIIDRDQVLETNIYDEKSFEYNTSLIRVCNSIVDIKFVGESEDGNLPVGNYTFYFKVADSDGNESDFIGQSGLVVCHKGKLNQPKSIDGGIASENSHKCVRFTISKIPRQFSRLYVYYSRYTCTPEGTLLTEYKKIDRYFDLNSNDYYSSDTKSVTIRITGNDTTHDVSLKALNPLNQNPLNAKAQAITSNRLFMANVKDNISIYQTLKEFSLTNVKVDPCQSENKDELLYDVYVDYETHGDSEKCGYYNVHNIYNKVGYWPEEYYRFGIVYILDDYTTTPVFNIRGSANGIKNDYGIIQFPKEYFKEYNGSDKNQINFYDVNTVHVLHFPKFTISKKPPESVIGCIFVRQKRLKNIIGQALLIGSDQDKRYIYGQSPDRKTFTARGSHIPVLWGGQRYKWVTQSFVKTVTSTRNYYNDGQYITEYYTDNYPDIEERKTYYNPSLGDHYNKPSDGNIEDNVCFPHSNDIITYNSPTSIFLGNSWITHQKNSKLYVFGNDHSSLSGNNDFAWLDGDSIKKNAALMPEFELKQLYYSGIFLGQEFNYNKVINFGQNTNINNQGINDWEGLQHLKLVDPIQESANESREAYIIGVQEQTTLKTKNNIYTSVIGSASEPSSYATPFTHKLMFLTQNTDEGQKNSYKNLGIEDSVVDEFSSKFGYLDFTYHTRGIFSPYLGFEDTTLQQDFDGYSLINIKINKPESNLNYYKEQIAYRQQDYSEFYPISDRIDFQDHFKNSQVDTFKCFRGDCYIGNFTHRMLRNFIDPEFQLQDDYASKYCWALGNRINFDENDPYLQEELDGHGKETGVASATIRKDIVKTHLNRSDINAVPLGQWITFKYYSNLNPCMRSTDSSNSLEYSTFGQPRKFYPLYGINLSSNKANKLADSYIYNEGYEQSVGQQMYDLYPEVPAIKEDFGNRVIYSDISIDSLITNNLRHFDNEGYRDYTRSYGNITKLVPWSENYLAIVFEHGLAIVQVHEKGVISEVAKQAVYIDTTNVLGDLNMQSEQYGSQWPESVISTPTGLYGIDASAKKIWRYYTQFESISDLKVGKFLKTNLSVSPISNQIDILKFNIKTHYNAKKQDIMFTFYKNLEYGNMLAWNLCYNEVTKKMTSFYSWIPLYSANINNTYYSLPFIPEMSSKYLINALNQDEIKLHIWEHNIKLNNWCNWYGEQHPFEFEYIVNANPNFQKIFNNLQIISNKAVPESFHFEIVGECYDFSKDKKNMYYRQEATKSFYDWCMSAILGNNNQDLIQYDKDGVNDIYLNRKLEQNPKSAIFPLKVKRVDYSNKIYDIYRQLTSSSKDYQSLSGSEIIYDPLTNDYLIDTHIKAHPKNSFVWQTICRTDDTDAYDIATYYVNRGIEIRTQGEYLQKKVFYGQRLSNCYYNEDSWYIQIPPINYYEKNEDWSKSDNKPPINLVTDPIPQEISGYSELPLNQNYPVETENWVIKRQTPIRDKYIRIKIRYTGDDFVVISGIINTFKESYN